MDGKTENKKYYLMNAKIYAKDSVQTVSQTISTTLRAAAIQDLRIISSTRPKRRAWLNCRRRTVILSICCTEVDYEKM